MRAVQRSDASEKLSNERLTKSFTDHCHDHYANHKDRSCRSDAERVTPWRPQNKKEQKPPR